MAQRQATNPNHGSQPHECYREWVATVSARRTGEPEFSPKRLSRKSRKFRRKRGYDKKLCYVYGLVDGYGKIGYVGQTRLDLESRLKWHFKSAVNGKTRLHRWIRQSMGIEIFMIDANATWDVSEVLWIERYRREGHNLMNVLRGGGDTIHAVKREGLYEPMS